MTDHCSHSFRQWRTDSHRLRPSRTRSSSVSSTRLSSICLNRIAHKCSDTASLNHSICHRHRRRLRSQLLLHRLVTQSCFLHVPHVQFVDRTVRSMRKCCSHLLRRSQHASIGHQCTHVKVSSTDDHLFCDPSLMTFRILRRKVHDRISGYPQPSLDLGPTKDEYF